MSCWWGGLGWLKHCSLSPQRCGFAGAHLFVSAGLWYAAHVDNLVHILHSLHLWQRQWAMEKGRGRSVCSRGRSVIWLQRNCTSDSCCYTWSDSLLLQLRWPHVQYDFTRSFPVLGNSFIFTHTSSLLTERQVHDLVIPLFPERLSIPVKIQPERREHEVLLGWCVYPTVGSTGLRVPVLLLSLSLPQLGGMSSASWRRTRDLTGGETWVTQHFSVWFPFFLHTVAFFKFYGISGCRIWSLQYPVVTQMTKESHPGWQQLVTPPPHPISAWNPAGEAPPRLNWLLIVGKVAVYGDHRDHICSAEIRPLTRVCFCKAWFVKALMSVHESTHQCRASYGLEKLLSRCERILSRSQHCSLKRSITVLSSTTSQTSSSFF